MDKYLKDEAIQLKEITVNELIEILNQYPKDAKFIVANTNDWTDLTYFGSVYFNESLNEVNVSMS